MFDHLLLSSNGVKNDRHCTYAPLICLHGMRAMTVCLQVKKIIIINFNLVQFKVGGGFLEWRSG